MLNKLNTVFHHSISLQLYLLHLSWSFLPNADISFLDLLACPQLCPNESTGLWFKGSWDWGRRIPLDHYFIVPWQPFCKSMVCICQCCCRLLPGDVCYDTSMMPRTSLYIPQIFSNIMVQNTTHQLSLIRTSILIKQLMQNLAHYTLVPCFP